ncbi:MAG: ferrochelatase [Betaproteobacteria bacterium]|nr:ferrochelatase [Betaproteobacteria bacterium]
MSRFAPEPPCQHGTPPRIGILLINLGTPEAPTAQAVRGYLREFLSDPAVVEIPRPLWWLILHGYVLRVRPGQSADRYARVWMSDGSPLKAHTQRQTTLLRGYIGERIKHPLVIDYAMRYGKPSIADKVRELKAQNCDRLLLVPLFPQYSASTTGTALSAVFGTLSRMRNMPAVRTVRHFHDHAGYVNALAQNVRDYWAKNGRPDRLIMSFHGLPRATLDKGDPYHCECQKSGRLLAEALSLKPEQHHIAFQSRFGRAEWLKPYTAELLAQLGRQKVGRVDVICPGFVSDCLETLEEIAIEGKTIFIQSGGREFNFIPCLNERDDWIQALTDIVLKHLLGWTIGPSPEELENSRLRAMAMGAKS